MVGAGQLRRGQRQQGVTLIAKSSRVFSSIILMLSLPLYLSCALARTHSRTRLCVYIGNSERNRNPPTFKAKEAH